MIKASELRPGNLITIDSPYWPKIKGVTLKVTEVASHGDKDFPESTGSISAEDTTNEWRESYSQFDQFVEGIELTPEWLERLGFIKEGKNKYAIYHDGVALFGYWTYDGAVNVGQFIPQEIKYVHTMQNLFFALTGRELELKK